MKLVHGHLWQLAFLAISVTGPLFLQSAAAQSSAGPQSAAVQTTDTLTWHRCSADAPAMLECADLAVPLDYSNPNGAKITIGLNRLRATGPAPRIGSLVYNPGGPGGVATEIIALEAAGTRVFGPSIRERFDVIGMDPRGVGTSTPVRCDPAIWNDRVSRFPQNQAEYDALIAHNRALGESCLRLTGPLLGHVDTVSVARDLESLRIALDDGKLNYLGLSYGTQLGHTYAELFPGNIRAMALDGALDHSLNPLAMLSNEATAYERELGRFVRWCDETSTCALHGRDVEAIYERLNAQAEAGRLRAPMCAESGFCRPTVSGEDFRFLVQGRLLFKEPVLDGYYGGWEDLATALAEALNGDGSGFAAGVAQNDTFPTFAELAIECMDWVTPITTFESIGATQLLARAVASHGRGSSQTWTIQAGCAGWPLPSVNPQRPAVVRGAPPILIINAFYDPSTAFPWAVGLLKQIEGSVLLVRNGDGHTSYLSSGPSRTKEAIDAYLVTGITPPPNTVYPD